MQKILVVNFFPAFTPACSGGELRLGSLYRSLSRTHDITMLTSTDFGARFEEINHTSTFRELRFPKDKLWRDAYAALNAQGVTGELSGLAFAMAVSDRACPLRIVARELAGNADLVIHEFPYSEPIFSDGSVADEVYNSHNFEISLVPSVLSGPGFEAAFLKVLRLEQNLVRRAARVFTTSQADADMFGLFFGVPAEKLAVCPNGYDEAELAAVEQIRRAPQSRRERRSLLFLGSSHAPNVEAARWLVDLARQAPQWDFTLAGSVCRALDAAALPPNVAAIGAVDHRTKHSLLATSDLFLNPVTLGSGTSLKALEALGAGLPMVSTPEGVRGLDVEHAVHAAVVSRDNFVAEIEALLGEDARRAEIARAGLAFARDRYTWTRVADGLARQLAEVAGAVEEAPARPFVVALNDYPALSEDWGGKVRIRQLLRHIDADVVLVSFGPACAFAMVGPGMLHVTVPKSAAHLAFEADVNRGNIASADDAIASLFVASHRVLGTILPALAQRANAIILEHCYMAPALDLIGTVRPDLPVIYSAHNIEAASKPELLARHGLRDILQSFIAELEQRVVALARFVVCCTDADARHFAAAGAETIVIGNGCSIPAPELLQALRGGGGEAERLRVGFLGSAHGPNVDAASFIIDEVAPAFPEVAFEFIGGVCQPLPAPVPPNVRLHGNLSDRAKTRAMAGWAVALNPILSGGGSSVKLADYMAHGIPSISTPVGARGFEVEQHGAGAVVELGAVKDTLASLLGERHLRESWRGNAYRYAVQELSWHAITKPYRDRLHQVMAAPAPAPRRSLLVVTYRYTEPPLGGAEEYLVNVLRWLRPQFARLDLAAIDTGAITNIHHFGCHVAGTGGGAPARIGELFDDALYFPPDPQPAAAVVRTARELEAVWSAEQQELYAPFLPDLSGTGRLRPLSGFFWPENHHGRLRRWTSPQFAFLVPGGTKVLRLAGWSPVAKTLALSLFAPPLGEAAAPLATGRFPLAGDFAVELGLPPSAPGQTLLLRCAVEANFADGDHRPFGVLLDKASVLRGGAGGAAQLDLLAETQGDLAADHEGELRARALDRWAAALIDVARKRPAAANAAFASVRGPHAAALYDWLARHGGEYDTVLVQGVPFDVVPHAVEVLRALPAPPRIVTLPHFHGDDRFYYWRPYLDAFAAADATLLFSEFFAQRLGPAEKFAVVPGGGVNVDELGDSAAVARFRRVHAGAAPFFLVLGRKTGSKGYDEVLKAHARLRQSFPAPDIVLIGPDEDQLPIAQDGVRYLGQQPREVVRGALMECLGVISMSRSESFGIVICEAGLFGKPVIANRACYSFRELVRDGSSGMLVSDVAELARAMRLLAQNRGLRERLGAALFREVVARFTWPGVARAVMNALQRPLPIVKETPHEAAVVPFARGVRRRESEIRTVSSGKQHRG